MDTPTHDFGKLRRQALERAAEMIDEHIDQALGDSPIEKLLFAALQLRSSLEATEYSTIRRVKTEEAERSLLDFLATPDPNTPIAPIGATTLLVRPQAQIGDGRVDFLIHALDWGDRKKPFKWRRLIVECDGHDYHERTKDQAKRDRSRDRRSLMEGYDCFRLTGSEIWNDPWGCAEQITDWAIKGWFRPR
jgi:very-short-patch-repair endonuclease